LELDRCDLHTVQELQQLQGTGRSYKCFSALTASTQLTALVLFEDLNVPVPKAAYTYMFPAKRVLPHLKVLRLESTTGPGPRPMGANEVTRIAAACPALQQLNLRGVCDWQLPSKSDCLLQLPATVTRIKGLRWTRPQQQTVLAAS
jgi:hypothetical protein